MRARLLAVTLAALAAGTLSAPARAGVEFDRECTGAVDAGCYHDFCGIADCTRSDCFVYLGVFGDGNSAFCAGKPRPSDPVE